MYPIIRPLNIDFFFFWRIFDRILLPMSPFVLSRCTACDVACFSEKKKNFLYTSLDFESSFPFEFSLHHFVVGKEEGRVVKTFWSCLCSGCLSSSYILSTLFSPYFVAVILYRTFSFSFLHIAVSIEILICMESMHT